MAVETIEVPTKTMELVPVCSRCKKPSKDAVRIELMRLEGDDIHSDVAGWEELISPDYCACQSCLSIITSAFVKKPRVRRTNAEIRAASGTTPDDLSQSDDATTFPV